MAQPTPDLTAEAALFAQGATSVAGIDEVGRGAWAGPVSVGVVVIRSVDDEAPEGLRDSKLLTPNARRRIDPLVRAWAAEHAVGHATPQECDALGMRAAIALASSRALNSLTSVPDAVIVDGPLDLLFPQSLELSALVKDHGWRNNPPTTVQAIVKADQTCGSVAAASVVAKVERDAIMGSLAESFPAFDFDRNAGYPSPAHQTALRGYGLTAIHRKSWSFTELVPWSKRVW